MGFLARVVLNLLRSLFLFKRATEKTPIHAPKPSFYSGYSGCFYSGLGAEFGADAVFDPEFGLGAFRAAIDDRIGILSLEENGELPEWMEAVFTPLKCEE